jgi:hypothetical protein
MGAASTSSVGDYHGALANCTLHRIEFTTRNNGGKPRRHRNLIRLNAGGFEFELHQDIRLPSNRFKLLGKQVHTTELIVRNVTAADVPLLRQVIRYMCELLSFATESRVLPYYFEYPAESGLGETHSMAGTVETWREPFAEPEHARKFVVTCYDRYVDLRNRRRLHVAIEYIRHSVMSLASEAQIAMACIAFENLRHNWAVDSGYPWIKGFFREKGATTAKPGPPVGIQRHFEEMFGEVHMACDAQRIVETRNEVVHTGLYSDATNEEMHNFLETSLREYFLRVLGYRGPFQPYIGGSPAPIMI